MNFIWGKAIRLEKDTLHIDSKHLAEDKQEPQASTGAEGSRG